MVSHLDLICLAQIQAFPVWGDRCSGLSHERLDITGIRGVTQAQKASLRALGAIEGTPSCQ